MNEDRFEGLFCAEERRVGSSLVEVIPVFGHLSCQRGGMLGTGRCVAEGHRRVRWQRSFGRLCYPLTVLWYPLTVPRVPSTLPAYLIILARQCPRSPSRVLTSPLRVWTINRTSTTEFSSDCDDAAPRRGHVRNLQRESVATSYG